MTRFNLFRALSPDNQYPSSPFNVTAQGVRYDLPVPDFVANALFRQLSPAGTFRRADEFCKPTGIDAVRSTPHILNSFDVPVYADSMFQLNLVGFDRQPMGYLLQQAVANEPAAAAIIGLAVEKRRFAKDITDWIVDRSAFFLHCRGFEIANIAYYFDTDGKTAVATYRTEISAGQQSNPALKRSENRLRFRDMANRSAPT